MEGGLTPCSSGNALAPRTAELDGLLILDKPVGPSSHDVVARARRALGERRIGHTGTLDPEASGVLPLVIGKATRLARFLSSTDKSYEAVIRLGISTTTYDGAGEPTGEHHAGPLPSRHAIDAALDPCRGSFMQQPPAYSAKKVGGHPSYKLARRADRRRAAGLEPTVSGEPMSHLAPARVTTSALEILKLDKDCVTLQVECSAGFYVRSLAHDLGERLGTGAHLVALRRTRSGDARLQDAMLLEVVEDGDRGREAAAAALIPLSQMLPELRALTLTDEGVQLARHGRLLRPSDFENPPNPVNLVNPSNLVNLVNPSNLVNLVNPVNPSNLVNLVNPVNPVNQVNRLLDSRGNLVGLARPSGALGLLHPFVVLV